MRHRRHPWRSAVFRHLLAVLGGMLWMTCGGLLLSMLLLFMGEPTAMVMQIMVHLLWCAGAFLSGRTAGLHGRRHGIRTGFICGLLLCAVLLCGVVLLHEAWHMTLLYRMGLILLSGICGGIIGVNTKLRRPPD